MAGGGWGKQGSGVPLAERRRTGNASDDVRRAGSSVESSVDCPARHCWVSDAVDGEGVKRPGLLIEWRQVGSGWEGRVVYAARLRREDAARAGWQLVEEWLPAALLTPL